MKYSKTKVKLRRSDRVERAIERAWFLVREQERIESTQKIQVKMPVTNQLVDFEICEMTVPATDAQIRQAKKNIRWNWRKYILNAKMREKRDKKFNRKKWTLDVQEDIVCYSMELEDANLTFDSYSS